MRDFLQAYHVTADSPLGSRGLLEEVKWAIRQISFLSPHIAVHALLWGQDNMNKNNMKS